MLLEIDGLDVEWNGGMECMIKGTQKNTSTHLLWPECNIILMVAMYETMTFQIWA
jgi:hypothetical protein